MPGSRDNEQTVVDPKDSAQSVGLRYVSDDRPGIRRRKSGMRFFYVRVDGSKLSEPDALRRIKALAIPPAWTDVWICASADGHIQATGRDAKGRKQYRYHPRFREVRESSKYEHVVAFADALPALRERVREHMARRGLPRDKVLATVVQLLETTFIRVGNDAYARQNNSYGLTTLKSRHATVDGNEVRFRFTGKSGKQWSSQVKDRRVAKINDPKHFPWTMGWQPSYQSEGRIYAQYLISNHPRGKVGILYQDDDYGEDYVKGLKDGLAGRMPVVAEQSYETSDPTIDSQIVNLRASGADILYDITTPKFAAQAIKKVSEISWKPLHILNNVSASIGSVLKPAGFDNSRGILSTAYFKDPTDPTWEGRQRLQEMGGVYGTKIPGWGSHELLHCLRLSGVADACRRPQALR